MSIAVFLGPSLAKSKAKKVLDATYFPPAKMGDIIRVVAEKPQAICIIDGYFEHTPAVWHKEILYALSQGISVFGGSSMGALRAAELDLYGMVGVGKIYQDFTSGRYEDDDEVAVLHSSEEDGYYNQSEAMANIRYGIKQAIELGIVSKCQGKELVSKQKERFYYYRSWEAVVSDAAELGMKTEDIAKLNDFIRQHKPNQKRDDAISLLEHVNSWLESNPAKHQANFELESTTFWEQAYNQCVNANSSQGNPSDRQNILDHFRLTNPGNNSVVSEALKLMLVAQEVKQKSYDSIDPAAAFSAFRQQRSLNTPEQLKEWMQSNYLGKEDVLELANLEAIVPSITQLGSEKFDHYMTLALKNNGLFASTLQQASEKFIIAQEMGLERSNTEDTETLDKAIQWYQQQYGNIHCSFAQQAAACGFDSQETFIESICELYLTSNI